jgi:Bacterial regulatory proteins, luxR family
MLLTRLQPRKGPGRLGGAALPNQSTGLSNRKTSDRLFVSQRTVRGTLRNIFTKLNVNSRVELAVSPVLRGMLTENRSPTRCSAGQNTFEPGTI